MTNEEIKEVLTLHQVWLDSDRTKGKRADLRYADLRKADLSEANLYGADLREADLWGSNLNGAKLNGADLREACLYGADLREANLYIAKLNGADLRGAKVALELCEVYSLRAAKVSEEHLPWLTGRSSFGKELPTLTIKNPV